MLYGGHAIISAKWHIIPSNVSNRTRECDRRTDGWTGSPRCGNSTMQLSRCRLKYDRRINFPAKHGCYFLTLTRKIILTSSIIFARMSEQLPSMLDLLYLHIYFNATGTIELKLLISTFLVPACVGLHLILSSFHILLYKINDVLIKFIYF